MNSWKTIETAEDINAFLSAVCHLHDATYGDCFYKNFENGEHQILTMKFDVFTVEPRTETLVRTGLEMEFGYIEHFNFLPKHYDLISSVMIKRIENGFIWGIEPGPACKLNEYGFAIDQTWVKCKSIKWRFCPVHEKESL